MKKTAFTLLEIIFSITILILIMEGAFALIASVTTFAPLTKSRLIASYLAQEGIEIIRNIRDQNWLVGNQWDANIVSAVIPNYIDYRSLSFPDLNCFLDYVYFDATEGYNCRRTGSITPFWRLITITKEDLNSDGSVDKMTVTIQVTWQERGRTHQVNVTEQLYNWR